MDKEVELGKAAPEQKLLVGGHWLEGQEWFEVRDKLSGEVLASVPICEDEMFEMALEAAYDGAHTLSARPPAERAKGLLAWAEVLESQRSALLPVLHREAAIPVLWADEEIRQAVALLTSAAQEIQRVQKEGASQGGSLFLTQPVGTVAAVLPERHALFYAALLAGVAIATGCPVILLAHPLAPLSVIKLVESALVGSWPAGTINLMYGMDRDLGAKLALDPRVALLAGAGSSRHRDSLAASRGLRPRVHLGAGFGCALLDRGADIPAAVTTLLARRFRSPRWGHAAPVFILSPQSLTAKLHDTLGQAMLSLPGGRPTDMTSVVPWQLTESAAQLAEDWLATVTEMGGKITCGGRRAGLYVEPTVITAPAGTRPLPAPPSHAPFFVIDSYDKQPRTQLARFPDITEAAVFTPEAGRAMELAKLAFVSRVEVFAPGPAGQVQGGSDNPHGLDLSTLMSDMTHRTRLEVVSTPSSAS